VSRANCATDRRGQVATLTDAGFAVLEAVAPSHVATVRQLVIDALTPDQLGELAAIGEAIIGRVTAAG
jgi:DNA-binding MarR family transcriptional regulator